MVVLDAVWQWTAAEYRRLGESGFFGEHKRIELIEGQIRVMSPISKFHSYIVRRINLLFADLFGAQYDISVQDPILLSDKSEPQPDVMVITRFDAPALPTAADVLLLVEVSDTTLRFDRDVKVPLYAAAGIPEVWVVDVNRDMIEQYHTPLDGVYTFQRNWAKDTHFMTTLGVEIESRKVFVA